MLRANTMPIDIPPDHRPPALMAPFSQVISQAEAENVSAAAWLDLHRDRTFQRFCESHGATTDSLVAHPDGTFSLQGQVSQGVLVQFFRPFDAGGNLVPPFSSMADALRWKASLDILLRHAYALDRDVGRDAIGISRMNGIGVMDMLEKAGPLTTHTATMASAFKFLDVFSALYRGDGMAGHGIDPSLFSTRFHGDGDLRYLAGWMTGLPAGELSAAATFKALGKLASMVWRTYAADVLLPEEDSIEARDRFIDSMRMVVTLRAASDGIHAANGTVDFTAAALYWLARDAARMMPLPTWATHEQATVPEASGVVPIPKSHEQPVVSTGDRHMPGENVSTTGRMDVHEQEKQGVAEAGEPGEVAPMVAPMVASVATFGGAVLVLGAGFKSGLTVAQKAAVVSIGNAASLAGATMLAVVVPGVGHALGVAGSSALLFSSVADYLVSAGIAPGLAKSAAVVEVMGMYILIGLSAGQTVEALLALAQNPGWREALRLTASVLATVGTVSASAPAADKADQFNIDDVRYGFFNEHPELPDRLGHSGNGVVLISQGVLQATDDTVLRRDGDRSAWDIFLSWYDPSGVPRRTKSH